jgi:hypothetical protein
MEAAGMIRKLQSAIWETILVLSILFATNAGAPQAQRGPDRPIRLHPKNPHYFLFRGKAIALIGSGEHYGAVLNLGVDYERYLTTIAADGLNYTRLFGGSYVEAPGKSFGILRNDLAPESGKFLAPWARSETPGYTGGGNKFDLSKWDASYFERFHDFLAAAAKRGIVVEISLFSSQYGELQWNVSPFNPANNVNGLDAIDWKKLETLENGNTLAFQEAYTRKLVHEAAGFDNVIFEIQNEPWSDRGSLAGVINPYLRTPGRDMFPNSVDLADKLSLAWQAKVVDWIASEESSLPHPHLIAEDYSNFRGSVRSVLPGVSVVNFHYAYPEAVAWNYGIGKAISYDETGFLGRNDDAYRREAWNFMMAGGSVFDQLDYSFSPGHEDGMDAEENGPGGGSAALRRQLRVLSEFLREFSLVDLRPDARVVKHASGVIAHALSNPGHEYGIYLDGSGSAEVTLELPAGEYSCEWMNVETGAITGREHFRHKGGEKMLVTPEFRNGTALRLSVIGQ